MLEHGMRQKTITLPTRMTASLKRRDMKRVSTSKLQFPVDPLDGCFKSFFRTVLGLYMAAM